MLFHLHLKAFFRAALDHFHTSLKWKGAIAKIQEYIVLQILKGRLKNITLDIEKIEDIHALIAAYKISCLLLKK